MKLHDDGERQKQQSCSFNGEGYMRPILKLPAVLANQIAAGEVIERPANVIKELIENSLDAGAKKIQIDVKQAGIQEIKVRDDGFGIAENDLSLAIAPHATSKISSLEELESIISFGFRGEALASISGVAEVSIASCQAGKTAYLLKSAPGAAVEITPTAHPTGTTITVRHLFLNIPVRRKFLKSEQTERAHIENTIKHLALSRFDVKITYRYNDKIIFQLPACQERAQEEARIAILMGDSFLKKAVFIETEASGLTLRGWFYHDKTGFSHNEFQAFFVNGRFVKDKILNHAMRQATLSFLDPGRFPGFILNLTLDPRLVDINVHPTKHEVRFRYPNQIHDFLLQALTRLIKNEVCSRESAFENDALKSIQAIALPNFYDLSTEPELKKTAQKPLSIAKWFDRFLMIQNDEGPILIDGFNLKRKLYQESLQASDQKKTLLFPVAFSLAYENTAVFAQASRFFECTQSATHAYIVRAVPACCEMNITSEWMVLFFETLKTLGNVKIIDWIASCFARDFMQRADTERLKDWLQTLSLTTNTPYIKQLSSETLAEVLLQ